MQNFLNSISAKTILVIVVVMTLASCKNDAKKSIVDSPVEEETILVLDSLKNPAQTGGAMSRLFSADDKLYMSWLQTQKDTTTLFLANYNGSDWSNPEKIAQGGDWFVNWADFTNVAVNDGAVFLHYLKKSAPDTYAYDVWFTVYDPATKQWSKHKKLHDDGTQSEHGFVAAVPDNDQGFFVSWLDGRNTVGVPMEEAQMTVRGAFIDARGEISKSTQLDNRVCDCCATATTMGPDGPLVAYRDRSSEEIRDISVVRWTGDAWSAPAVGTEDNWKIAGCPVNGPALAANGDSVTMANFTNNDNEAKVFVSFSNDKGVTFNSRVRVDIDSPMGRVDLLMQDDQSAVVLWMEAVDDTAFLYLRKVWSNGSLSEPIIVAQTSMERASGFSQLEIFKDDFVVSYTLISDKKSGIEIVRIPTAAFSL